MRTADTICVLPWNHIATKVDGTIRPCCISTFSTSYLTKLRSAPKPSIYKGSFSEILDSDYLADIRAKMLLGEEPDECQVCFKSEKRGVLSKRQQENEKWTHDRSTVKARYIDLRFNSNCNLKCIMCSAQESSSWVTDAKNYGFKTDNEYLKNYFSDSLPSGEKRNFKTFLESFKKELPDIKEIYFAGGEPLLQKEHTICLDLIIEMGFNKEICLTYNTNGTLLNSDVIEKWSLFKKVQINFSLDSIESQNEYIRFPSKWNSTRQALNLLDQSPENISIRLTTTVSALNIFYINELIAWKTAQKFNKIQTSLAPGDVDINILHFPAHLNVQIFSDGDKKRIESKLRLLLALDTISKQFKERLLGLITFMNEGSLNGVSGLNNFKDYLKLLDQERNLNSSSTFPFLADVSFG